MKYTYKDECFISDKSDVHGIILVLVLVCVDVLLFFAAIGFYILKGRASLFSMEWITVLLTLGSAWSVHHSIRHRQKPALERRRRRMEEGTRYTGKIVDAGMVMESEQVSDPHDTRSRTDPNEYDKFQDCYRRVPNYWIMVEYFDPQSGQTKRAYANHMVRSMEHLIGRSVDVYDGQEWCKFLKKYTPYSYVDTSAL